MPAHNFRTPSPVISRRHLVGRSLATALTIAGGRYGARAQTPSPAACSTIALTHATVIDGTGSPAQEETTIVIERGRLATIGPSVSTAAPTGSRVVDMTGKFLIPGLHDMHVHSPATGSDEIALPLYLANGVTTVREMDGPPALHEWQRRIEQGELQGPRMIIASPILDGQTSTIRDASEANAYPVTTAAEARETVRRVVAEGADFIKIYHRVSPDAFFAIADESARLGIPLAGHCPDLVPWTDASAAGQKSFEHLFWTWFSTSSEEAAIREALARMVLEPGNYNTWFEQIHEVEMLAAKHFDPIVAADAFSLVAEHGSYQVPTLWMHRVLDRPDEVPVADDRTRYLPPMAIEFQDYGLNELYRAGRTRTQAGEWSALFDHRLRLVQSMHEAGLKLLAGSDSGTPPHSFPGFSLHDELTLLVDAGLSPMAALQSATRTPAEFLGTSTESGTLETGKIADLVVLDGDPLEDIRNTTRIHGVVVRGQLLDREALDHLLAGVESAARNESSHVQPHAGCGLACAPGSPATTHCGCSGHHA